MSYPFVETPLALLKGVGPKRAELLAAELGVKTFGDLLLHAPFRYEDRSGFSSVGDIASDAVGVQLSGIISRVEQAGAAQARRTVAKFKDATGECDLVWFKGGAWVAAHLPVGVPVVVYGKPQRYGNRWNIPHPEVEAAATFAARGGQGLQPVYPSTVLLGQRGMGSAGIARLVANLLELPGFHIPDPLPEVLRQESRLMERQAAVRAVHRPAHAEEAAHARRRLAFDELLLLQLMLVRRKQELTRNQPGVRFAVVGDLFNRFYSERLPFDLTQAQKRVLREIRADVNTGWHMNRLLQGDVGSGKTVVALLTALLALDNGHQACIMAPTEILAQQHFASFTELLGDLPIRTALLTGNVKGPARRQALEGIAAGEVGIAIGTHALIEPGVVFRQLGLAVIDEQHRFGVEQRAKLWAKSTTPPHVLVMTATPIPRTLAMTAYGDLDVSLLDELPPGRKPIRTVHRTDAARDAVFGFLEDELALGRQVYVVYPLIEESETLEFKDLMDGYESIVRRFPLPDYRVGIVHGRQRPEDKEFEMRRFISGETHILVATTVIEVGVNVPNASVMVVESAERFGLSQLHQLRGRVGRGSDASYCILMTREGLGRDALRRVETMCRTQDGFEIAEVDMELRGPGDVMGTQQSGMPDLRVADLLRDREILAAARYTATVVLESDPGLTLPVHAGLAEELRRVRSSRRDWSRIS